MTLRPGQDVWLLMLSLIYYICIMGEYSRLLDHPLCFSSFCWHNVTYSYVSYHQVPPSFLLPGELVGSSSKLCPASVSSVYYIEIRHRVLYISLIGFHLRFLRIRLRYRTCFRVEVTPDLVLYTVGSVLLYYSVKGRLWVCKQFTKRKYPISLTKYNSFIIYVLF